MSENLPQDNRGFVQHWRRVAPLLEAIKRQELREFDHAANVEIIDALLQLGVDHGQPRTTSGLVELQRRLHGGKLQGEPGASATGGPGASENSGR